MLTWDYSKDYGTSSNIDAGWVAQVSFVPVSWLQAAGSSVSGQFRLILHGVPGNAYQILASSNIVNWETQGTITIPATNTSGTVLYTDCFRQTSRGAFTAHSNSLSKLETEVNGRFDGGERREAGPTRRRRRAVKTSQTQSARPVMREVSRSQSSVIRPRGFRNERCVSASRMEPVEHMPKQRLLERALC